MVIWIQHASCANEFSDHLLRPRHMGLSLYQILSTINMAWVLFLVVDLLSVLRLSTNLRKGKLIGLVLSILVIATVQLAVLAMKSAADALAVR